MQTTALLHVSIDWDNLDETWGYVTMDNHGLWAHEEMPFLDANGFYASYGMSMQLAPVRRVLFERGNPEPMEPTQDEVKL